MAIHKIKFFAGRGSRYLAEKIVASYGTTLGNSEVQQFSDGEFQMCIRDSRYESTGFLKGSRCYFNAGSNTTP